MKTHIVELNGSTSTVIMAGFYKNSDLRKKKELVVVSNDELKAGDEIHLLIHTRFAKRVRQQEVFKNIQILEQKDTKLNYQYSYRLSYE